MTRTGLRTGDKSVDAKGAKQRRGRKGNPGLERIGNRQTAGVIERPITHHPSPITHHSSPIFACAILGGELSTGKKMKKVHYIVAGLLLALGALPLHADEVEPPKVHKQGSSTYVSGGVDEPQRKAMFKVAPKYPIQLIFEVRGEVDGVTGVKVTLRDIGGNAILEAVSEGPYFYINPPAGGRYTIEAEFNGEKQSMTKDLVGRRYLILEYKFTAG